MKSNGASGGSDIATDILIAGGGFVGMSLALALARAAPGAFRIALVDADAADPAARQGAADPRASALSAASRNLLAMLGIWQRIEQGAQAIGAIEITDSPLHAERARPPLLNFGAELQAGEAHIVENAPLLAALAAAVAAEPAITRIAPEAVTGYTAESFGVTAALNGGGHIRAALLVAADGRFSRLREAARIKSIAWTYPQSGIVTTVAHQRPHHGKAVQHFLPAGPFALLPLTGDRTSIVWSEEKGEAARIMALDDAGFLAELEQRFGQQLGRLQLAGPRRSFPLGLHIARRFVAERFVLIGDAAHGVHPLAGQGLNIGFRDVAALAETLVEGARLGLDPGSAALLERYERWRRFDSTISALAMDLMNRLFSNDRKILRELRDLGLGVVNRLPEVKRFLVQEAAGKTGRLPRLLEGRPI